MFTGIIEEMGTMAALEEIEGGWNMTIHAQKVLEGVKLGDSISVNGACVTIATMGDVWFTVGLAPETLRLTNLGDLQPGDPLNLERSVVANGRMDGHFVQGHVDGTGVIRSMTEDGDSLWVTVETPPEILKYIVKKAYVAVDGTSLTVTEVFDDAFSFMLIAYTQTQIIIPQKQEGDRVNLEVDIMSKYVEKFLEESGKGKGESGK